MTALPESDLRALIGQLRTELDAGKLSVVETLCQQILGHSPDNPEAISYQGLVRVQQDRYHEAIDLFERAVAGDPGQAFYHLNLGSASRTLGQFDKARSAYLKAIDLKPDFGRAWEGLCKIVRFEPGDPLIAKAAANAERRNLSSDDKCFLNFALGKMYDDIGAYDLAFRHYQQGNLDSGRRFDSAAHRRFIMDTVYIFSDYYLKSVTEPGLDTCQPVFVVGMPRSGTTLIEQILDAHSAVFAAGELYDIKYIAKSLQQSARADLPYPNCMPLLIPGQIHRAANDYLTRLRQLTDNALISRVVDKHPLNFQYIGLILRLFPNAKIIHARRDPLDTCLSCYFQHFTSGQDYSFELRALSNFYNDYRRLMEHWQSRHTESILNIDYESLVENPEHESKRMLAFCGLDWEDRCLEFYRSDRVVKTASFLQVRQPIYRRSRRRWTHYQHHLKGLAANLGIDLQKH